MGCNYRGGGPDISAYMTTRGRVADFNMWDSSLSQVEMAEITSCQKFSEGNMVNWESTDWVMNSTKGTIQKYEMDLETDICRSTASSLALVPYGMTFEHRALNLCPRLSGTVASYTNEKGLNEITKYLSR